MAIGGGQLQDFWLKFANAMGIPVEEPRADGGWEALFADGLRFVLLPWRGEAAFAGEVARVPDSPIEAAELARHFLRVSLAKAADWDESVYCEEGRLYLWRRFVDAGDEDFSLAGVEKFLNRVEFWRRQADYAEALARRQAPAAGSFIAFDQFG